ncbi:hypothetical protein BDV38DRAFT_282708 [Aspergillus pseudotamarii]|uniref:Uncharacterized protein n=1 Tax=Aspergillus pseudotamarii TaxID=132259 RepID=A0A5N6ST07_ASPPS|nr:uncharacterized protein BDV38DRAFT_282708 [Aspergillus pseudotamarii]KAE8137775.1 hypothetical protein BDV38DRAFT_282708 [Aspergillus pseudotamarii]
MPESLAGNKLSERYISLLGFLSFRFVTTIIAFFSGRNPSTMAWFPSDPNWNDFYLPAGTEQELKDLESIFGDIQQPTNQTHATPPYTRSDLPEVDFMTPNPHSSIAPLAQHNLGLGNQLMMSRDSPQPQSMTPAPHAEPPSEQSVNPKVTPKGRKPRGHRKSVELQ